ncbi:MAG: hypothetical protein D6732_20515, partial [Methanobacteriota archaeon]
FRNGNIYSGADKYAYDANGNMTRDDNKGIDVTYNELNLPTEVDFGNDNRIEWMYSASGEELQKDVKFHLCAYIAVGIERSGSVYCVR